MAGEYIFEDACAYLGIAPEQVMSHAVYKDHIALVVDNGIKGCPKHLIPLETLADEANWPELEGEAEAKAEVEPKPEAVFDVEVTDGAREYALKHGVDLAAIIGSGQDGRIILRDVRAAKRLSEEAQ